MTIAFWTGRTFNVRAFDWLWAYIADWTSDGIWAIYWLWTQGRIRALYTIFTYDRGWTYLTFITNDWFWASWAAFNLATINFASFTSFLLHSLLMSNHCFIHISNDRVYSRRTSINYSLSSLCDLSWDCRTIRIFESISEIDLDAKHQKHENESHGCLFLLLLSRFISVLLYYEVFLQLSNLLVLIK